MLCRAAGQRAPCAGFRAESRYKFGFRYRCQLAQRADSPESKNLRMLLVRPEQARDNAAASALPALSPALHEQLTQFYRERVADQIRGPY